MTSDSMALSSSTSSSRASPCLQKSRRPSIGGRVPAPGTPPSPPSPIPLLLPPAARDRAEGPSLRTTSAPDAFPAVDLRQERGGDHRVEDLEPVDRREHRAAAAAAGADVGGALPDGVADVHQPPPPRRRREVP